MTAYVDELKSSPCTDCGGRFDVVCMDFDHRPGETKRFGIAARGERTLADVKAEIAKCDLVCANCHRIRTHRQRDHQALAGTRKPKAPQLTPQLSIEACK